MTSEVSTLNSYLFDLLAAIFYSSYHNSPLLISLQNLFLKLYFFLASCHPYTKHSQGRHLPSQCPDLLADFPTSISQTPPCSLAGKTTLTSARCPRRSFADLGIRSQFSLKSLEGLQCHQILACSLYPPIQEQTSSNKASGSWA